MLLPSLKAILGRTDDNSYWERGEGEAQRQRSRKDQTEHLGDILPWGGEG